MDCEWPLPSTSPGVDQGRLRHLCLLDDEKAASNSHWHRGRGPWDRKSRMEYESYESNWQGNGAHRRRCSFRPPETEFLVRLWVSFEKRCEQKAPYLDTENIRNQSLALRLYDVLMYCVFSNSRSYGRGAVRSPTWVPGGGFWGT